MYLFIRTFCITTSILVVIIFAGWLTLQNIMKAPDIPVHGQEPPATDEPSDASQDAAYTVPEPAGEDTLIGDGLHAPEGFTDSDRRDYFYTFLIFGLDNGVNTDTIMVASYDGINKEAHIIGIPRDTKVNVKRSIKKINAAYPVGTTNGGGRTGGVEQLKREIKTIIGFTPDFYICIDFKAFVKVVDAVGGVVVDVPYDMIYDDPEQNLHINIKQGTRQTLTGEQALHFARYRRGNRNSATITDYQRIENQQAVIKALLEKLLRPANVFRIPEFVDIFTENVYTDIGLTDLLWFSDQFKDITGTDALHVYTIPTSGTSGSPHYYEYLDDQAVIALINDTINPFIKDIERKDLDIAGP